MKFTERPYQTAGKNMILGSESGAMLAFPPGSGKTPTALTAADILLHDQLRGERVLVVGPKLVAQEVWTREAPKWDHLKHLQIWHIGAEVFRLRRTTKVHKAPGGVEVEEFALEPEDWKATRAEILARPERIMTISRDHFRRLTEVMRSKWPWDIVIWDESTSIKTHNSKRAQALRFLRRRGKIKMFIPLSGTPRPKSMEQFWSQILPIDNGERLGATLGELRTEYMLPNQIEVRGRQVVQWEDRPGAIEKAMAAVRDICISVDASVWRKTEPPQLIERPITLPERAARMYETLSEKKVLKLPGGATVLATDPAVLAGKLLQIAAGFVIDNEGVAHWLHDEKINALLELIEELDGEPLVVFYWHQAVEKRLKEAVKGIATTKTKGFIDRFAARELPVLMLHPAGAGHGLDGLQHGGHTMAAVELFPDWELYQQTVSRLDRSGQAHQVSVHHIVAPGTRDDRISRILADREADQGRIIEALRWDR